MQRRNTFPLISRPTMATSSSSSSTVQLEESTKTTWPAQERCNSVFANPSYRAASNYSQAKKRSASASSSSSTAMTTYSSSPPPAKM